MSDPKGEFEAAVAGSKVAGPRRQRWPDIKERTPERIWLAASGGSPFGVNRLERRKNKARAAQSERRAKRKALRARGPRWFMPIRREARG